MTHYVETSVLKRIISEIYNKIEDKVKSNEFMFIFPCLHIELDNGDTYHFPLGAFSIPQKCSSAYISFNANDVNRFLNEKSSFKEKVNLYAQYLVTKVLSKIFDCFYTPVKIQKIQLTYVNTAHRHPGNFGFSTTDTSREKDNPGILYIRNPEKIKDTYGVDLVFYLPYSTKIEFPEVWVRYFKEPYQFQESTTVYSIYDVDTKQEKKDKNEKVKKVANKRIWTTSYNDTNKLEPIKLIDWEQFIPFPNDLIKIDLNHYEEERQFFRYSYGKDYINYYKDFTIDEPKSQGVPNVDVETSSEETNRDSENIRENNRTSIDFPYQREEKQFKDYRFSRQNLLHQNREMEETIKQLHNKKDSTSD